MDNKVIISIVNRGFAEDVMTAAKANGARGGTIIYGRGTGSAYAKSVLGIKIEPEKELVLIVADKNLCVAIMTAIYESVGLGTPGSGICFALPIDNLIGITTIAADSHDEGDIAPDKSDDTHPADKDTNNT